MPENNALDQFSLAGRHFIVTGASSGLGRAMATYLSQAGASVLLLARRADQLQIAAETIREQGGKADFVIADLSQRENIVEIAQQCKEKAGATIDGVINAAGVNLRQPAEQITLESWDLTLNLNLAIPFFFSREFVPEMQAQGYGRIINIASLQSSRAFANGLAYGASKGGVCQLTRAMAQAWSKDNICCNAIAPGFFPTELTEAVFNDEAMSEGFAAQTAIGRNGQLDDLFGITVFFASAASSYVTGQTLHIDGGFTAK